MDFPADIAEAVHSFENVSASYKFYIGGYLKRHRIAPKAKSFWMDRYTVGSLFCGCTVFV